jgi:hypothetical protein
MVVLTMGNRVSGDGVTGEEFTAETGDLRFSPYYPITL